MKDYPVNNIKEKENRNLYLKQELEILVRSGKLPKPFSFALDSRMEAKEFSIEECKVMDSKKVPLWLAVKPNCENEDDEKFEIMFENLMKEKQQKEEDENLNNVSIHINDENNKLNQDVPVINSRPNRNLI